MSADAKTATARTALLLVGSPKPTAGASAAFAAAVGSRLEAAGWETSTRRIAPTFSSADRMRELLEAIAESDLVVLSFPVYVDSLPAPVLRLLEAWRDARDAGALVPASVPRLAVLTQCGFPEAKHCEVAVEVCRLFAKEVGAEWAGALAFGMGGSIDGRPLERSPLGRVMPEFEMATAALSKGRPIPAESTEAFARPLAPAWTYPLLGGFMWARQARRQGCTEPLTLRRYAQ
jgi:hypothetical protein